MKFFFEWLKGLDELAILVVPLGLLCIAMCIVLPVEKVMTGITDDRRLQFKVEQQKTIQLTHKNIKPNSCGSCHTPKEQIPDGNPQD